jgi:acyl carrier protein
LTIEQEFSIEIPDKEADAIHSGRFQWRIAVQSYIVLTSATVTQAVDYICHQPDGMCSSSSTNNAYTDPATAH